MSKLQNKYLIFCLKQMMGILNNEKEQDDALHALTEGKEDDSRYQAFSRTLGTMCWSAKKRLALHAALFEAHARASTKFGLCDKDIKTIQAALDALLIPQLKALITQMSIDGDFTLLNKGFMDYIAILEENERATSLRNEYLFFTLTAGALITTTAAGVILAQQLSRP